MKKSIIALMAAMAVAVFCWPSICLGDGRPDGDRFEPIDEQEYLAAMRDTALYNIYPKELTGDSAIKEEFVSKVIEIDTEAKDFYSERMTYPGWCGFYLYEIIWENKTIYMLRCIFPFSDFCYLATKAADSTLSVSDVRIESAPIVFSKNGYIAGFLETEDEFYTRLTINKFSVDKTTGSVSITKIGTTLECNGLYVCLYYDHPVFWHDGTLYISGGELRPKENSEYPDYYSDPIAVFYKLTLSE